MSKKQDLAALHSCIVRGEKISIPQPDPGFENGIEVVSRKTIYENMDPLALLKKSKTHGGIRDVFETYIRPIMVI